jgi:hypothetical protein
MVAGDAAAPWIDSGKVGPSTGLMRQRPLPSTINGHRGRSEIVRDGSNDRPAAMSGNAIRSLT